jgi:hypothetical protein
MSPATEGEPEMTECVILFRNPHNGAVGFVSKGDTDVDPEEIMTYPHRDAAIAEIDNVPILKVAPFQIVELEDL